MYSWHFLRRSIIVSRSPSIRLLVGNSADPRIYRDPHARVKDSQECVSDHPASFETPLFLSSTKVRNIYWRRIPWFPLCHRDYPIHFYAPSRKAECRFSFRHSLFPTAGNLIPFTCREYRYIAGKRARVDAFCLRETSSSPFFLFFFFLPPPLSAPVRNASHEKSRRRFSLFIFSQRANNLGAPRMRFVLYKGKIFWIVHDFFFSFFFFHFRESFWELEIFVFLCKW